jgi:hypothetical protein
MQAVRSAAGLKLKNNIRTEYDGMHASVQHYIKEQVL